MPPEQTLAPDVDTIYAHLRWLTRRWAEIGDHQLEIRLLSDASPLVLRTATSDDGLKDIARDIAHWNEKGRRAYCCVNPVRPNADRRKGWAKDEDIIAAFACFADCDDAGAAESLKNFVGPKYNWCVVTGSVPYPRPHPYWELEAPITDMAEWTRLQKGIAAALGSDSVVVNPSRIMRIAGTLTHPDDKKRNDKGYIQEVVTLRTGQEYDPPRPYVPLEQMQRAFGQNAASAPQQATDGFAVDMGPTPLNREAAIGKALSGAEWHNNIVRLVASYVSKGLGDAEIHALTQPLTLTGYTAEQTAAEVQKAIDGARSKGWAPEARPVEFSPAKAPNAGSATEDASALEWFDDIEPSLTDSYIIKGLLGDGALSVVYGPSNSGKTFFALDLAYHIAIGASWRGRRVRGGGVLYLAAEGGKGLVNRVAALRKAHGVCDVPLAVRRAGLDLLRSESDLQHLVDLAAEVNQRSPLRVIVVDTLSRVIAGGDENAASDMTALIRNLGAIQKHTGAHVCLIHHSGKDTARGARGHSSLRAATDTEIEVQCEEDDRAAIVSKQRDYQGGECFAFALKSVDLGTDQDGDAISSCVVEAADSEDFKAQRARTKQLGGNQKIIADAFEMLLGDGARYPNPGGVGFPEPGQFWCVEYDRLRALSVGKIPAKDAPKAFQQAFRALVDDRGLFCMTEKSVWRVDRKIKSTK